MKKYSLIMLLIIASTILRSEGCGLVGDSNSTTDDNPTHETQIIVEFGNYDGVGNDAEVFIDSKSIGSLKSGKSLTAKVTEGDHTVSATGNFPTVASWPATTLAVLAGQTFRYKLGFSPAKLTLVPSAECAGKQIIFEVTYDGNSNAYYSFAPISTETTTVNISTGYATIKAKVGNDGLPGGTWYTPFLNGGNAYTVDLFCN